jgi:hypothetical protein
VHDDVERGGAEVVSQALGEPRDGEVAHVLVSLAGAQLLWRVGERVEGRVERVDPLELQLRAIGQLSRLVEFSALEEVEKDVECRRPGAHTDRSSGFGERLGNGEPEARVVRDARHECPPSGEVDRKHGEYMGGAAEQFKAAGTG